MSGKPDEDTFNEYPPNITSIGRETSRLSSRPTTSYSTERDPSFYRGRSFYGYSPRPCDTRTSDRRQEISRLSDDYIQREQTILSKHDPCTFPEKPRELFNPLHGIIKDRKVSSKTFNVLPSITTPRALTSHRSSSSQLGSVHETGTNNSFNSPRLADITPVTLPPINRARWNSLRQSDDVSVYNERVCWEISNASDNSCGYNSSTDDYL